MLHNINTQSGIRACPYGIKRLSPIRKGQTMQHSLRFTVFILFALAFQLLGCSEDPDTDTTSVEKVIAEPIPPKPTPEDTFAKLKMLFPKPIFDVDFTRLDEVTTSKTYLDFVTQEYRTKKPFKTLAEYLEVAKPDPERYKPFLKESIGKSNEEDIAIIHQITLDYRCANVRLYQMIHGGEDNIKDGLNAIFAVIEKKLLILDEAPVKAWMEIHLPNQDQAKEFSTDLERFVTETEKKDALFIQEQFEQHGKDDGLLWLAVHNPALTAEILNNFTNTDVFLRWTEGIFFQQNP